MLIDHASNLKDIIAAVMRLDAKGEMENPIYSVTEFVGQNYTLQWCESSPLDLVQFESLDKLSFLHLHHDDEIRSKRLEFE
jgi:hypothetical protein